MGYLGIVSCMNTSNPLTAREYLRVSRDASGRERSPEEQHGDNQRAADGRNWKLGKAYKDVGSASRYASKAREDFGKLMSDLEKGRFAASILILWESSRGSRKVSEWVRLIELCEEKQVCIFVTSDGKLYDPSDARDRRSLLEDSVDAEYESAKVSKRAKRAQAANAAAGMPNGKVPYGYRRIYDPTTRRFVAQEPEPKEAKVIKELFDRLAKGHALKAIARDFEQRGIKSRSGKVFSPQHLRALALCCSYAGQREHTPGRKGTHRRSSATTYTKAVWKPLVPMSRFLAVQRILSDPKRVTVRPGKAMHLLSFVAVCDVCDGPLAARTDPDRTDTQQYHCHRGGHVRLPYDALNAYAESVMLAYLSRADNWAKLAADPGADERLEGLRDQVATIQAELDELADAVGRGTLSASLAARAEPAIVARLEAARTELARLSTPSVLSGILEPGPNISRRWRAIPCSAKREVARLLLTPQVLGQLRVKRSPVRGHRVPIEDRVSWR